MREGRRREPERLVQQNLPRRVRDVILAADHVRHLHQRIVDDDGEVVGGRAVGADDDGIADDVGVKADVAADGVGEHDVAVVGHAEADGRTLAGRDARRAPARGDSRRHVPGVARRPPGGERLLPVGLELLARSRSSSTRASALSSSCAYDWYKMQPLGLPVRPARPADVRALVPVEAEPAQVAQDRRFRLARRALDVGVLDAQDERRRRMPRASSQLNSAVRALPTCSWPVGLGAKRTRMHLELWTRIRLEDFGIQVSVDCASSAIACAAIASPRPTASTPSLVLPLTLTRVDVDAERRGERRAHRVDMSRGASAPRGSP